MNPENWVFSHMLYTENGTVLGCWYIFDIPQQFWQELAIVFAPP